MKKLCAPAAYLARLTAFPDRRPGSPDNDAAVEIAAEALRELGWQVRTPEFDITAWQGGQGRLERDGVTVPVRPSPYGCGTDTVATLVEAGDRAALAALAEDGRAAGQVLLVHGELSAWPLMPQDYPFYRQPGDDEVRTLLMRCAPAALIAATGRAPELAGAVDPFPFIEDGRFPIPVADMRPEQLPQLLTWAGRPVRASLDGRRWAARARNVVAGQVGEGTRLVVTAHIDTKPGTPGALDNATGVVILLLLAARLDPCAPVELVAFNGEDHFSAAGEVHYLSGLGGVDGPLEEVRLAVNIDGAGHRDGPTAWSAYNLDDATLDRARAVLTQPGLVEGDQWWQSDHAIFARRGRPAVAFTSADLQRLLGEVVHTEHDTAELVDIAALITVADAIANLVAALTPPAG